MMRVVPAPGLGELMMQLMLLLMLLFKHFSFKVETVGAAATGLLRVIPRPSQLSKISTLMCSPHSAGT